MGRETRSLMEWFLRYGLTALICIVALGQFVQVVMRYVPEVPAMGLGENMLCPKLKRRT